MRLLNANTLQLEEFFSNPRGIPHYAILSHTWGIEEVTLEDMRNGNAETKLGFQKIKFACYQARLDGYGYAWVDTCCIDKSSSSELSEAINSMFQWYRKSEVCYAYLEGVSAEDMYDSRVPDDFHMLPADEVSFRTSKFAQHRWFQRGWTLQELIAPSDVRFYGKYWEYLGSSLDLLGEIIAITGIDDKVLGSDTILKMEFLRRATIAQKMSWAASRSTTRIEDEAYCLLGLFDVHMPLIYGEGATAFIRLQEEIIKTCTDQSIFVWHASPEAENERLLLAPRVSCFKNCGTVRPLLQRRAESYTMVNAGLSIQLPIITVTEDSIAILSCYYADDPRGPIGLSVQSNGYSGRTYYVSSIRSKYGERLHGLHKYEGRNFAVDSSDIDDESYKTNLLLRQPPIDFSLPLAPLALETFAKEAATAVLIHEDFGSCRDYLPHMQLDFSIKALYPSMYWSQTLSKLPSTRGPARKKNILLLPPQAQIAAIRVWYKATSFFITFGPERRNWHREALDSWIKIHDAENDMAIREVVRREERLHRVDGFALSKSGRNKATLVPKRFPDDCLEVWISRKYVMDEETFELCSRVKKLTLSPPVLQRHSPQSCGSTSQVGYGGQYQRAIEWWPSYHYPTHHRRPRESRGSYYY